MNWYKVSFSYDDISKGKPMQLQIAFENIFLLSGAPEDAAMFFSLDVMHPDRLFSPAAAAMAKPLIESFGGIECPAPKRSEVGILVANHQARSVAFG